MGQTYADAPLTAAQKASFTDAPLTPPAEPTTYAGDVARYAGGEVKGFARGLTDVINPMTYFQMGQGVVEGLKNLPAYVHGFSKEDITTHLPAFLAETARQTLQDPEQLGRVMGNVVTGAAIKGVPITEGGPTVGQALVAGRDAIANKLPIHPAMQAIAEKLGLSDQLLAKETGLSVEDVNFAQRYGMDPDRIDMATTKLQLQTAKKATRIATQLRKWADDAAASAAPRTPTEQPLVMTPAQLQQHEQQMANAALLAREQGMKSAAYGKAAWDAPRQAAPQPAATLPVETSAAPNTPLPVDRPVPATPAAPTAAAGPAWMKLTAEEATQYQALRTLGKSGAEAEASILKARALAKALGTPSEAAVANAVRARNTTGRWEP